MTPTSLLPDAGVRQARTVVDPRSLLSPEDPPAPEISVLLVAGAASRERTRPPLLRALAAQRAVVGPTVPWLEVATSLSRALRCLGPDGPPRQTLDTDAMLAEVVVEADPLALADLRADILRPLADLRPTTVAKLTETLRAWLLHQGRREAIAEGLFVHPQTVRYRVTQLREVYGERLEDPDFVRDATIALGTLSSDIRDMPTAD